MIKLSQQQRGERWDSLPEILREAIVSETNSDFIWKTCQAEFIPEEKIYDVAGITGSVLSGFVHPEDMATELADTLKVDRRIADTISSAINQRIFVPLRPEIDKVYSLGISVAPTVLSTTTLNAKVISPPIPTAPQPLAPKPLSDKGWSTMQVSNISSKPQPAPMSFSQIPIKIPVGVPAPSTMPMPRPPMAPLEVPGQPSASSLPVPPQAPRPAPMPAMIIRGSDAPAPIKNAPDFHSVTSTQNMMSPRISASMPIRPVVLEMTGMPAPIPGKTAVPIPSAPQAKPDVTRVVHYSDFKSSLPAQLPVGKAPVAESGRQVTLMTIGSPIPQRPTPSVPLMPQPVPTQNFAPMTPITKSPIAPVPMPKPIPAPAPVAPQQAMPALSAIPKPPMPKLTMTPSPLQAAPLPPKPMNSPITAPAAPVVPRPIPEKIIVKDFTEGK